MIVPFSTGLFSNSSQLLTPFANVMLRIEASTFDGERAQMIFEKFKADNKKKLYKLTCVKVVEDPLSLANLWKVTVDGMPFSTRDRDNDKRHISCA